jgi:hypothetical protein
LASLVLKSDDFDDLRQKPEGLQNNDILFSPILVGFLRVWCAGSVRSLFLGIIWLDSMHSDMLFLEKVEGTRSVATIGRFATSCVLQFRNFYLI